VIWVGEVEANAQELQARGGNQSCHTREWAMASLAASPNLPKNQGWLARKIEEKKMSLLETFLQT
jgi:hypothetical protein